MDQGVRRFIRLPNSWAPRPYQRKSWSAWESGCLREILIWHRRAGKDDVQLHKTAVAAHKRIGNYWHTLPAYSQGRKAIWEAVNPRTSKRRIDEAFPKELRAATREDDMSIRFTNGSTWKLVGSDNPDSLVGSPPIGITFSEYALANPASWAYLAPILAENGGWASFITTPRGRGNHAYKMLQLARQNPWFPGHRAGWFAEVLTVDETGFDPIIVEQQRVEYHALYGLDAGDALVDQEYYCSFDAAVLGAYYAKPLNRLERAGQIAAVAADPLLPINTAWDLGKGANMYMWLFQNAGSELRVLAGIPGAHDEVIEDCLDKIEKWRAAHAPDCKWGIDFVPHDAKVKELGSGKTRVETFIRLGRRPVLVPGHKIDDGIAAARLVIPQSWFDAVHCEEGLEALRLYRADYDEDLKIFRNVPLHDWTSHAADAFRYLAMAWRKIRPEIVVPKPRMKDYTQLTLNELFELNERPTKGGTRI